MNTSYGKIKTITFDRQNMTVHFSDGRKLITPLEWYPRLLNATPRQRSKWEILGQSRGIHWPAVDEDLSIEGILHGIPSVEYRKPRRVNKKSTQQEARV